MDGFYFVLVTVYNRVQLRVVHANKSYFTESADECFLLEIVQKFDKNFSK